MIQTPATTLSRQVVMIGATGAVGSQTVNALLATHELHRLTLLGRRELADLSADQSPQVHQVTVDLLDPKTYESQLAGHDTAICTVGVGQPSQVSKEEFAKIDKSLVLDFATACKRANVQHFLLLSSVGSSSDSKSFFLRTKGELIDELRALEFSRLSIFQPSMILTPENRYGLVQGLTLAVWPLLEPLLAASLRKYRGVRVEALGGSIAANVFAEGAGERILQWDDFLKR